MPHGWNTRPIRRVIFIWRYDDERQRAGQEQKQLSKEFVRQWLIANGFQGREGQVVPAMSDEWVNEISARYIELFEKVTGKSFEKGSYSDILPDVESAIVHALEHTPAL